MTSNKFGSRIAIVAALVLVAATVSAAPASNPASSRAIADPSRPEADRVMDAARHPAELLAFLHVKAGETIADVWPGDYWDRLFARLVGPKGKVYAVHLVAADKAEKVTTPAAGSMPIADHANVVAAVTDANTLTLPTRADIIWMRQNYHDLYDPFMGPADVPAFNKAVYRALKPGGRFVIIDHVAPAGSKLEATNTTHRIDPDVVKADMAAAGFRLVGESDLLRNPADQHTASVFDASVRGHTDQFVYVFQRP
jgi:predicted methyltransferase